MAITVEQVGIGPLGERIVRHRDTGTANNALTMTIQGGKGKVLTEVTAVYSNTPVQTGVTIARDNGAGAAYDATLNTGTANVRVTAWIPDGLVAIPSGDGILITAPAGGANITCAVSAITLEAGPSK